MGVGAAECVVRELGVDGPGWRTKALMPTSAPSVGQRFRQPSCDDFATPYPEMFGAPRSAARLEMMMMRPPPRSRMP